MIRRCCAMVLTIVLLMVQTNAQTFLKNIGDSYISLPVDSGKTVTNIFHEVEGVDFTGYTVDKGNITLSSPTSPISSFTMPSEDVTISCNYTGDVLVNIRQGVEAGENVIVYNPNGGTGTMEPQYITPGETITLSPNAFRKSGYEFIGWSINRTDKKALYTDCQRIKIGNGMTLYAIWLNKSELLENKVRIGDYIQYIPSTTLYNVANTGSSSSQSISPSNYTSWRVFDIKGSDVDIISADSVSNLTLYGETGYKNAVQTLQDVSKAYVNPTYAIDGRHLGYSEKGLTSDELSKYLMLSSLLGGNEGRFPHSDVQYRDDTTQLSAYGLYSSSTTYLASRDYSESSSYERFNIRTIASDGTVSISNLARWGASTSDDREYSVSCGVRPIISLLSGLRVTGGSGSASDPYTIINENSEKTFTLTYDANGGSGAPESESFTRKSLSATFKISNTVPTRSGHMFLGWSTNKNELRADFENGEDITIKRDTTLYAIWMDSSNFLSTKVRAGDYITYIPNKTSVTVSASSSGTDSDQTFNPSETTSWRVFNNDGTNVEIISADNAVNLTLKGTTGYQYAVQTLQNLSKAYINSKYAINGRSLGYSEKGLTQEEIEQNYLEITSLISYNRIDSADAWVPTYMDNQYSYDTTILYNNNLAVSSATWLASRSIRYDSSLDSYELRVRTATNTEVSASYLRDQAKSASDRETYTRTYGVRPVITLNYDVSVKSGSGTQADPYIICTPQICTLSYDAKGGSNAPEPQSLLGLTGSPEFTISSTIPTRTGYTFKGWSTSSSATTVHYNPSDLITLTSNKTLYAVWEANTYEVILNTQDATTAGTTSVTATFDSAMPTITVPTKTTYTTILNYNYTDASNTMLDTYTFEGYYTETNGGGTQYYTSTGASAKNWDKTSATTLYAKWAGSESVTLPTPIREGYTFGGWYTEAECTNLVGEGGAIYTPTVAMTLYAKWTIKTYTLTVTQTAGGTITPETTTVDHGTNQTFTITANSGYTINTLNVDGIVNVLSTKTSTFVTDSNFTVTGSGSYPWKVSGSNFISSNNGKNSTTSTSTIKLSGTGTLSFDYSVSSESGWDKLTITVADASGTTTAVNAISGTNSGSYSKEVSGDITITLTYSKDGSGNTGDDRGTISNLKLEVEPLQCTSYTFENVTANHTITATYEHPITLTYDANGGSNAPASETVTVIGEESTNFTISSTVPTRDGHTFLGWATTSDATSAEYNSGDNITISNSITLYAVWQIKTYTLTVTQTAGGTISPGTTTVNHGTNQTFTITPNDGYTIKTVEIDGGLKISNFVTDDNFTVTGSGSYPWKVSGSSFISSNNGVNSSTSTSTIKLSGTGTLSFDYSVSSEGGYDKLTITVADASGTTTAVNAISGTNSGSYSKEVSGDITITLTYSKDSSSASGNDRGTISNLKLEVEPLQCTSYTFENVTANHTITATYELASVNLTFNANGGTCDTANKTVTYGSTYGTLPTATRDGYTFNGWYTAASGGTKIEASTTVSITTDQTLYAQWTAGTYTE